MHGGTVLTNANIEHLQNDGNSAPFRAGQRLASPFVNYEMSQVAGSSPAPATTSKEESSSTKIGEDSLFC